MKGLQQLFRIGHCAALAFGLTLMVGGCGGGPKDGETTPEIAAAQQNESSAWAKAKSEGKDKRTTSQLPSNPGGRGYVNRPGS